jgi:hypothetical protein
MDTLLNVMCGQARKGAPHVEGGTHDNLKVSFQIYVGRGTCSPMGAQIPRGI